jgi:hypothetical protein
MLAALSRDFTRCVEKKIGERHGLSADALRVNTLVDSAPAKLNHERSAIGVSGGRFAE